MSAHFYGARELNSSNVSYWDEAQRTGILELTHVEQFLDPRWNLTLHERRQVERAQRFLRGSVRKRSNRARLRSIAGDLHLILSKRGDFLIPLRDGEPDSSTLEKLSNRSVGGGAIDHVFLTSYPSVTLEGERWRLATSPILRWRQGERKNFSGTHGNLSPARVTERVSPLLALLREAVHKLMSKENTGVPWERVRDNYEILSDSEVRAIILFLYRFNPRGESAYTRTFSKGLYLDQALPALRAFEQVLAHREALEITNPRRAFRYTVPAEALRDGVDSLRRALKEGEAERDSYQSVHEHYARYFHCVQVTELRSHVEITRAYRCFVSEPSDVNFNAYVLAAKRFADVSFEELDLRHLELTGPWYLDDEALRSLFHEERAWLAPHVDRLTSLEVRESSPTRYFKR